MRSATLVAYYALQIPMDVYTTQLKTGITRTKAFEKKGLAQFAANVGTKCGHDCLYCSTGAQLRRHKSFKEANRNPFDNGYAIVDPTSPEQVRRAARSVRPGRRGVIQLCTTVDAWSPEAQQHNLGALCLEAILGEPGWSVRILTKNAAVGKDFDLIERYRDRVQVGVTLTGTPAKSSILAALEPNASRVEERMEVLAAAHRRGLRTYGMLCPLLPGIANSASDIKELVRFSLSHGAEEIFAEPVNSRGKGLSMVEDTLRSIDGSIADAVAAVRNRVGWSHYTRQLIDDVQQSLRRQKSLHKLRFLLYPGQLTDEDRSWVENNNDGVKWLINEKNKLSVA